MKSITPCFTAQVSQRSFSPVLHKHMKVKRCSKTLLTFPVRLQLQSAGAKGAVVRRCLAQGGVPAALGATGERHLMATFTSATGEGKREREKPTRAGLRMAPWAEDQAGRCHGPWVRSPSQLPGAGISVEHSQELPCAASSSSSTSAQ